MSGAPPAMCLINSVLLAPGTQKYRTVLAVLYVSAILTQCAIGFEVHKTSVNQDPLVT